MRTLIAILLLVQCCVGAVQVQSGPPTEAFVWPDDCGSFASCLSAIATAYEQQGFYNTCLAVEYYGDDTLVLIDPGRQFQFSNLILTGIKDSVLSEVSSKFDFDLPLTATVIDSFCRSVTRDYAESGYPFAKLEVLGGSIRDSSLILECSLITGPETPVGGVRYRGLSVTLPRTLDSRISLRPGELYRESNLARSAAALSKLDFCRLSDVPLVIYNNRTTAADIYFPMAERRTLSFDGALFLLPDNTLAGNVDLLLQNLLGGGRQLSLLWGKKDESSQHLSFALKLPRFSGQPVDLNLRLSQEDRDSSFVATDAAFGLRYDLGSRWLVGAEVGWRKVTPEEDRSTPSARLIDIALESGYDGRDDIEQTRAGLMFESLFRSGYRREFAPGDTAANGYSTELSADLKLWRKLSKSIGLFVRTRAFQISSDFEPIPVDQLITVGGGQLMRGYRDDSFLARIGLLTALELRWYALDRLLFRVFADNGYIGTVDDDFGMTGFGGGFTVVTSAGRIRFDMSVGEEKSLDHLLVHFGFEGEL